MFEEGLERVGKGQVCMLSIRSRESKCVYEGQDLIIRAF